MAEAVGVIGNFRARLMRSAGGPLVVRVKNPDLPHVAENVACDMFDCAHGLDAWWFVWSDGQTVGPAEDASGAAVVITRVLGSR